MFLRVSAYFRGFPQEALPVKDTSVSAEPFNCHIIAIFGTNLFPVGASVFAWVFLVARDPAAKMSEKTEN